MKTMTTARDARRGFTLIELLVVIAIIAILAAILFPVFAQAKLAAKKTADLSNIKQIMTSTQMYLGDFDDIYPMLRNSAPKYTVPAMAAQLNTGHIVLDPYVKSRSIWLSPNDTMPRCDTGSAYYPPTYQGNGSGGGVSYVFTYNSGTIASRPYGFGISGWDSVSATTGANNVNMSTSKGGTEIGAPADTIFLVPSYFSWNYWYGSMQQRSDQREYAFTPDKLSNGLPDWPKVIQGGTFWACTNETFAMGSYGGITNWGFADGHAKAMKRAAIMDSMWATDPTNAKAQFKKNLIHWDGAFHGQ